MAHPSRPVVLACALACALVGGVPARAGSVTASSVWDQDNALQRAREQLPKGATVTRERCEELNMGLDNFRYRCTLWFEPPAPAENSDGSAGSAS